MAYPNVGQPQMMYPEQNYNFPGADYVDEVPIIQSGGTIVELTDEEIEEYRRGGYIVEEYAIGGEGGGEPTEPKPAFKKTEKFYDEARELEEGRKLYKSYKEELLKLKRLKEKEEQDVRNKRQNILNIAQSLTENPRPTRTNLDYIAPSDYYCNTRSCEIFQDAGLTIPEGTEPFTVNKKVYKPGDQVPIIPGNMQMKGVLKNLGFLPVDESNLKPGDLAQEEVYKSRDYQGNKFSPRFVPSHSMIKANKDYYNAPGGDRTNYEITPISFYGEKGKDWRIQGYRYEGALPYYNNLLKDVQSKFEQYSQYADIPVEQLPIKKDAYLLNNLSKVPESILPSSTVDWQNKRKEEIKNSEFSSKEKRKLYKSFKQQGGTIPKFQTTGEKRLTPEELIGNQQEDVWGKMRKEFDQVDTEKRINETNKDVINYYNQYMRSPRYKEMLGPNPDIAKQREYNLGFYPGRMPEVNVAKDQSSGEPSWGGYSMPDTGDITILPLGYNLKGLLPHEWSHSMDRPENLYSKRAIPKKDIDYINKVTPTDSKILEVPRLSNFQGFTFNQLREEYPEVLEYETNWKNYVSQPTEVRARLNDIRYQSKKRNLYDPFTQKVTPDIYQKLLNTKFETGDNKGFDALKQLKGIYTDEQILYMLNNISQKENPQNEELNIAQNGGTISKFQTGDEKKPVPNLFNFDPTPEYVGYQGNVPVSESTTVANTYRPTQQEIKATKEYSQKVGATAKAIKEKTGVSHKEAMQQAEQVLDANSRVPSEAKPYANTKQAQERDAYVFDEGMNARDYFRYPLQFLSGNVPTQEERIQDRIRITDPRTSRLDKFMGTVGEAGSLAPEALLNTGIGLAFAPANLSKLGMVADAVSPIGNPKSVFNTRAQNDILLEQARKSGEAPLPSYMEPYISRRYTPASKEQDIFESFLSPEKQAELRQSRTQTFTPEGVNTPKQLPSSGKANTNNSIYFEVVPEHFRGKDAYKIKKNDKWIGDFDFEQSESGDWVIGNVGLNNEYKRKGLGKEAFIYANDLLKNQGRGLLHSSGNFVGNDAKYVWESLVKEGKAEKIGPDSWRFINTPKQLPGSSAASSVGNAGRGFKQQGGIVLDLSEDEIRKYLEGGYIVEEL
jgi:hypothetical protein